MCKRWERRKICNLNWIENEISKWWLRNEIELILFSPLLSTFVTQLSLFNNFFFSEQHYLSSLSTFYLPYSFFHALILKCSLCFLEYQFLQSRKNRMADDFFSSLLLISSFSCSLPLLTMCASLSFYSHSFRILKKMRRKKKKEEEMRKKRKEEEKGYWMKKNWKRKRMKGTEGRMEWIEEGAAKIELGFFFLRRFPLPWFCYIFLPASSDFSYPSSSSPLMISSLWLDWFFFLLLFSFQHFLQRVSL